MEFFTSPQDLKGWIRIQESPDVAAHRIFDIVGKNEEQDIVDTCRSIFNGTRENEIDNASQVLFDVLAKHNITQRREGKMNDKIKREAQLMRGEAPLYGNMDLRICPKLPFSQGKRLISTYNCRHWCLDSIVFDDDPNRVYCAEALWRDHVMDKFSREFKNDKGEIVGGYINERFQVYHDNAGNPLQLNRGERTRKPRPYAYSTERRLNEARGEEEYDLKSEMSSSKNIVKIASKIENECDEHVYSIFSDMIEMKESGLTDEDILIKVSEHYNLSLEKTAFIYKMASAQLKRHSGTRYIYKTSQNIPQETTMVSLTDVEINTLTNEKKILKSGTPVVMVLSEENPVFEIVSGLDAGIRFTLSNNIDINKVFEISDAIDEKIQDGANEIGLNEEIVDLNSQTTPEEIPTNNA